MNKTSRLAALLLAFLFCSPLRPGFSQEAKKGDDASKDGSAAAPKADASSAMKGATNSKDANPAEDVDAKPSARVYKTDEEWRRILTPDQFMVTRMKATEPAFSGRYASGHFQGTFLCVCCGAKLFDARTKFDSGTGWPSFDRPITAKAVSEALDRSEPELRIEVVCSRCGAHLGHVFNDGPTLTGLRYCMNSVALKLDGEPERPTTRKRTPVRSTRRTSPAATPKDDDPKIVPNAKKGDS